MRLQIFNKESAGSGRLQSDVRSINVNRRNGGFVLSAALCSQLGVKKGDHVMFAKDEESKDGWYMCVTASELGYGIYEKSTCKGRYITRSRYATCKLFAASILDAIKAKRAASLLVAAKPVEVDGVEWYQIITSKPLRITQ